MLYSDERNTDESDGVCSYLGESALGEHTVEIVSTGASLTRLQQVAM